MGAGRRRGSRKEPALTKGETESGPSSPLARIGAARNVLQFERQVHENTYSV